MKRPQKIQNRKNQRLNFSKNQKLLESVHGARRTVVPKYLDVLGGVPTNNVQTLNLNFVRRLIYTSPKKIIFKIFKICIYTTIFYLVEGESGLGEVVQFCRSCPVWSEISRFGGRHLFGPFSELRGSWELIFRYVSGLGYVFRFLDFLWSRVPRKVPGKFLRFDGNLRFG